MVNVNGTSYKRTINTYLKSSNKKYQEIISSVFGQLSDGMWENSPAMEKYWRDADKIEDIDGYIHIGLEQGCYAFDGKSDADVKKWFAEKIKILVKDETGKWGRELQDECSYISYHEKITIADAYACYDILKERVGHEYGETAQHTKDLKEGKKASTEIIKQIKEFNANKLSDIKDLKRKLDSLINSDGFNTLPEAQKGTFTNIYNKAKEFIEAVQNV